MRPRLSIIIFFPITLLSLGLALFSYRYVVRVGSVPPNIALNRYFHPWLTIHAVGAGTALLLGPFQLSERMRGRWPHTHRWSGRIYIVCCFVGAITGVVLAAGTTSGNVAGAGFATGSILWLYVTSQGWYEATQRAWERHRAWMIRSFAFAFSAIPFRALLLILFRFGVRQVPAEQIASWLSWAVNAIVAEVYLRHRVMTALNPNISASTKEPGSATTTVS
jgi:hypothetical protein